MKRTHDDAGHERANWEWRSRHSHQPQLPPRVVEVAAEDEALWEETRRKRAARRAELRRQKRAIGWKNVAVLGVTGAVSLVLWVYTAKAYMAYGDFDEQVQAKRAQLHALEEQQTAARARVTLLSSDKGRAQLLVERGYLRPNERILLFPARGSEAERQRAARIPANDLMSPAVAPEPTRWQKLRAILGGLLR